MERVNLIPNDLAVTWMDRAVFILNRRFLTVLIWSLGTIVVFEAGLGFSYGVMAQQYHRRTAALQSKRVTLVADLENAKATVKQLERVEQDLRGQAERLMQRIAYLTLYRESSGEWADTLKELKRALPYGVWLTDLDGAKGVVRLAGGAFDDALVSQFMGQLEQNARFGTVAFSYTRQAKIGQTNVVEFEISCQRARVGPASP